MPRCHTCDEFYFLRPRLEKFMDQFYCEKCIPFNHAALVVKKTSLVFREDSLREDDLPEIEK